MVGKKYFNTGNYLLAKKEEVSWLRKKSLLKRPWISCGPCQMIAPHVEELAKAYSGKLKVCKLNVDEDPEKYNTLVKEFNSLYAKIKLNEHEI